MITFVVPILGNQMTKLERFLGHVKSFNSKRKIQVIIVSDYDYSEYLEKYKGVLETLYCQDEKKGTYSAMNDALVSIRRPYVCFYGIDDLPLPNLQFILNEIVEEEYGNTIFVGEAIMGSQYILKPIKMRFGIFLKNWCHQAVIYPSKIFEKYQFDVRYNIQADHDLNIKLCYEDNLYVKFLDFPIAYFDMTGASQNSIDFNFRNALPLIARQRLGWWFCLVIKTKQVFGSIRRYL